MRLLRFQGPGAAVPRLGLQEEEREECGAVVELSEAEPAPPRSVRAFLESGEHGLAAARRRATIKGLSGFVAEQEAQVLTKAMKGFGTDEDAVIDVLAKLNVSQGQQVLISYKSTTGRALVADLKSELSGNFERVIIGMMTPTTVYDVHGLRRAVEFSGE